MNFKNSRVVAFSSLICVIGLLFGVMIACGGSGSSNKEAEKISEVSEVKKMSRDEFKKAVMYKNQKQVLEIFGRPDSTADMGKGVDWTYIRRTFDPINEKNDHSVTVRFWYGRVEYLTFVQ